MKIYELRWTSQDERELIQERTAIEALKTYFATTDISISDLDDENEIIEVSKEEWSKMTVRNTEYDEND